MSLLETVIGRRLKSSEESKESLSVPTGVPVLGFDALSSVAYGPEAALAVLAALSVPGLHYLPRITLAILVLLALLYVSYLQTIGAYPNGGGSYTVAKENLGTEPGLFAAAALLLDYVLNVAVGISAGVAALVSAIPALHQYVLPLCLLALLILTLVNLRGVRESGLVFELPAVAFVGCVGATIVIGLIRSLEAHGQPSAVVQPPALPAAAAGVSVWLLLRAFANGCTAMTGVEAVSNGVPLFNEPRVLNARWTLTVVVVLLALMLAGVAYLCPIFHIGAMDQSQPGYQTTLSMLVGAVAGHGAFYYAAMATILMILIFSANTSFADFPRVCRLLARDGFLPHSFAERGRRLVYANGIIALALFSAAILTVFGGITEKLIPLFAVGAFSAFTLSQAGMVAHWKRNGGNGARASLIANGFGATATGITLIIIIAAKFVEGAWISLVAVPALMLLFHRINGHYRRIERAIGSNIKLKASKPPLLSVIIPIEDWN
ncbi:MAG TPA: APC family permease, partial [Blastocatellia bacterium]